MAYILNIETATEIATVSISEKNTILNSATSNNQKDHASFLQPAIKTLLEKADLSINKLSAVAVTAGPGSYTGLRVGMATAKGLSYALQIPMITLNTLEIIALTSIKKFDDETGLFCAMIDARRMEVFTAVYDFHLTEIVKPCHMFLLHSSFNDLLQTNKIYFSGNGIFKFNEILKNENARFIDNESNIYAMAELSYTYYQNKNFANLFYSVPLYLKEFYTPQKK